MRIKLIKFAMVLLLVSVSSAWGDEQSQSRESGSVEGKVIDGRTEQPIANATVTAWPEEGSAARLISAATDRQGKFVLEGLSTGRYEIAASKEQDWYPDTGVAAFQAGFERLPGVLVQGGEIVHNVTIRLAKGGRVVGMVVDAQSQQPVVNAQLRLSRADIPKLWISKGPDERGHFEFVIPDAAFLLEVSAPGYHGWSFSQTRPNGRAVLQVRPESTETLTILLGKE